MTEKTDSKWISLATAPILGQPPGTTSDYIGRFAPSPTGPLHLGSLYTALASFLHARANKGQWLLRIDDLDSFRHVATATDSIIASLEAHGLLWDGPIFYQSENLEAYHAVIQNLQQQNLLYPCVCTRKALAAKGFSVYPGYCRTVKINPKKTHALRIKSSNEQIDFCDEIQGFQSHQIALQHGDFIIKRKDGIIAYQLAVAVDDHRQKISHVVRGFDLMDSTPKQIFIQHTLGYFTPTYSHVPIIVDAQNNKLSKQTFAKAVNDKEAQKTLFLLLQLLKQNPPHHLKTASIKTLLRWGIDNWQVKTLKKTRAISQIIY